MVCSLWLCFLIHLKTAVGNVFKDFLAMSNPVAYSLGLLVGFLVSYWIPPRIDMPFFKWLGLSVIVAMVIFILERMFTPV